MMDCRECRSLLDAYLDQDLAHTARGDLERHLEACHSCRAEHALLVRTVFLMRELEELAPSAAFEGRVLAALGAATARVPLWRQLLPAGLVPWEKRWAKAAVAGLLCAEGLVIGAVLWVLSPSFLFWLGGSLTQLLKAGAARAGALFAALGAVLEPLGVLARALVVVANAIPPTLMAAMCMTVMLLGVFWLRLLTLERVRRTHVVPI